MSGNVSNKKEKAASKAGRILNSAMAFVIAYLIIMFFFYIVTALIGKVFGFDAQVYYYGVKFQLGKHRWTSFNVFCIWSFGTLFTAIMGILCFYLYSLFKEKGAIANLVALWGTIIAFSITAAQGVLPCLVSSNEQTSFYTNLSIVFNFLSLPMVVVYIICILLLLILAFISTATGKAFLSFSYSFSKVNKSSRKRKYFLETVIVPYILASFILLVFFYRTYQYVGFIYQNIVYLSVVGASLIVSLFVISISDIKSDEVLRYKNLQQISASLFVIMMALFVFLAVTWQGFYLPF